jgi:thiamine biosynthesis lipoprotein
MPFAMKKNLTIAVIFALAVIAAIWFYPKSRLEYKKAHGEIQGTTYNITYQFNKNTDLQPEIEKILHDFGKSLSTYDSNSVISKINCNKSLTTDDLFREVFNKAVEVNKKSDGAFDITIAPIVNAWGFGFTPGSNVDSVLIDSLMAFVGMEKVQLEGTKIIKSKPSVMLDVNAIAQGFSVDIVCRYFDKNQIKNYLVEIGGELKSKGVNPKGEDWKIGIDKPIDGNNMAGESLQAIIAIKSRALSTSGNYRRFYKKNGIKYAHTMDPKTGYPVLSHLLSATVMADDCMTADAYATVFMVFGLEKSIEFLSKNNFLEAYLVYSDDYGKLKVFTTDGMKGYIVEEEP